MFKDKNGEWFYNSGEKAVWYNPHESEIIAPYMQFIGEFGEWPKFQKLTLENGTLLYVEFKGCGDSENDYEMNHPKYEEFYEFYYTILKIENKPHQFKFKVGDLIYFNYHNFPVKWERLTDDENEKFKFDK